MKLRLIIYFFLLPLLFQAQSSNTVGNATSIGDDCYLVTPSQDWQNGAVWFSDPLNLTEEFTIDLNINFGIYDSNGADGMVFVMQTVGTNLLGVSGGGLGYEGINPSLGVELDTWQNTDMGDPLQDHISIISDGNVNHSASTNLSGPVPASSSNSNIEDGQFHQFRLNWIPDINTLEVYFDCDLRISVEVDIMNDIFDGVTQVYWGFTGSTGGSNNNQSVCLNEFTLGLPETETICNGESIQMGVNGGEASSYLWIPNEGINDPTEQYPIFNPSVSTYYTVEYTDYCGETQFQNVNIDVTDFSIDIAPEIDLCNNEAFLFEPDVPEGSVLLWNNEIESPTFTADEEGFVEVYGEYLGCSAVSTSMVNVIDFSIDIAPEIDLCNNEAFLFEPDVPEGSVLLWNNEIESSTFTVDEEGFVVVYGEYLGCSDVSSSIVTVIDFSVDIASEIDLCNNEAFLFEPDVPEGSVLLWNNEIESPTFTVDEEGSVAVYGEYLGCSDVSASMVNMTFFSIDIAPEIDLCNNEAFLFEPNVPEGSVLLWNNEIESPTFTVDEEGFVEVYGEYLGCSDVSSSMVNMTYFSIDIASEIDLCNNEAFLFEPDVPEGSVLLWNNEIESPTFTVDEEGSVAVYGEYLGCSDVSSSMVAVNPLPAPFYPTENIVETCENEVVELNAYCDGCVYDWGGYDEPIYYSVNEAGVHTVEITNEYGCTSLFSYTIHVTSSPQITLDSLYQFCKGTAGVLSTGLNSTNMNVIWNTNDTTSMINVTETGEYSVYASNLCGSDETSTFVSFDECSCDIWAPTAFTPDNDGVNDVFVPIIRCDAVSYQLNIYNRWGEVVFYSTNQGEIWTGCVHNGDYFSRDGVYAWEVSYSSQSDQLILHQARGHVILIR